MASTQPRIKGSNNQNIAIGTSQDGQMELHGDVGRGYCGWSPPKQSFFCCAFYSILCIVMAIVIIVTNSPTYDQEYNNPAEYYVANGTVIYVKEWQFLADYIKGLYFVKRFLYCFEFTSIYYCYYYISRI